MATNKMYSKRSSSLTSAENRTVPNLISQYDKCMNKEMKRQKVFEPHKLLAEHKKLVDCLTRGLSDDEKGDVTYLLDTHLCNMIERQEFKTWQNSGKNGGAILFVYFISNWVYVCAYTKSLGKVDITFGKQHAKHAGFPGYVSRSNGKLKWGYDYDRNTLTPEERSKYRLMNHIEDASGGNKESKKLTTEMLQRVKAFTAEIIKEKISRVIAVTHIFRPKIVSLLRECFNDAGCKQVVILGDSALSAYHHLKLLPESSDGQNLVVTVNVVNSKDMKVDVFAGEVRKGEMIGVKHLAAVSGIYFNETIKESAKKLYARAIEQIPACTKFALRYYVVVPECSASWKTLLDCANEEGKLPKLRNITSNNLLDIFSHFSNDMDKMRIFMDTSVSLLTEALEEPCLEPVASNVHISSTGEINSNGDAAINASRLLLEIRTLDGNEYSMVAYANWTVGKLKEEIQLISGRRNSDPFNFRYKAEVNQDEEMFLSSDKLDPDLTLQTQLNKIERTSEGNNGRIERGNVTVCQIIANCVALKNGSEHEYVEGIKQGKLVLARTDPENLTMGEIGVTCRIDGIKDMVFVGVKFRKNLSLGSSGVAIEHVEGTEAECDKCKGRKCLFIPLDHIGHSKDYLFEVQ